MEVQLALAYMTERTEAFQMSFRNLKTTQGITVDQRSEISTEGMIGSTKSKLSKNRGSRPRGYDYQKETLRGEADSLGNDRGVILITDCECTRHRF